MKTLCFDIETERFEPYNMAPRIACVGWADSEGQSGVIQYPRAWFEATLRDCARGSLVLTNHNIAYDLAVICSNYPELIPLVFEACETFNVYDTECTQRLIDLDRDRQRVGYSLADLVPGLVKDETRVTYDRVIDTPIESWPKRYIEYAKEDAIAALKLHQSQAPHPPDSSRQAVWRFAFQLMSVWGITTDQRYLRKVEARYIRAKAEARAMLKDAGLIRPNGTKNKKALQELVVLEFGDKTPRTDKGNVQTTADKLLSANDPTLKAWVDHERAHKMLSPYVKAAKPPIVHGYFQTVLATGRTSASDNLQTLPKVGGIREAYVARPGTVFCLVDLDGAELRALAQVWYWLMGDNPMADAFRNDAEADLHSMLAANIRGVPYAEVLAHKKTKYAKDRQDSKAGNFGLGGGMGAQRFRDHQEEQYHKTGGSQGAIMTLDRAHEIRNAWFRTWAPGPQKYFEWVKNHLTKTKRTKEGKQYQVGKHETWMTERTSWCGYCDYANRSFQALVADAMKRALYYVQKEAYSDPSSHLWGTRAVNFVHDEIIAEVPEERAHEAAHRLRDVIVEHSQALMPDIPITASPALARRWYKDAEPVYRNGDLVPWEPKEQP